MNREIETPDWIFVREAIASPGLLSLRLKWSWRHFTWIYVYRVNYERWRRINDITGERMSSAAVMTILDLMNECQEPGQLSINDRHRLNLARTNMRGKGKMFISSTVEDMDKGRPLWWRTENNKSDDTY